jgi:hypothetical protein
MSFQALHSELFRFKFHSLGSKIEKIPEFSPSIMFFDEFFSISFHCFYIFTPSTASVNMMELFYPSRDLKKKMSLLLNFYQTNIFGSVSMISMGKEYSPIHMENRQLTSIGVLMSRIILRIKSTLSILMEVLIIGMILINRNRNSKEIRSTLFVSIFPPVFNEENKSESTKNILFNISESYYIS